MKLDCIPKGDNKQQQEIAEKLQALLRDQECVQQQSVLIDSMISSKK